MVCTCSACAELRARCRKLIDNLATDVPGAADDEDTIHRGPSCSMPLLRRPGRGIVKSTLP